MAVILILLGFDLHGLLIVIICFGLALRTSYFFIPFTNRVIDRLGMQKLFHVCAYPKSEILLDRYLTN